MVAGDSAKKIAQGHGTFPQVNLLLAVESTEVPCPPSALASNVTHRSAVSPKWFL